MANLSGTWYSHGDLDLPDFSTAQRCAQAVFWNIKAILTGQVTGPVVGFNGAVPAGALWTMDQCSDSTQVKTDGTDLFGGAFDASKIVRSSGGARSWYVLKSPAALAGNGPYYMLISLDGVNDQSVSIFFSKIRPTGGATNAAPASTDQWGYGSNNFAWTINEARNLRANIAIEADGSFWIVFVRVGAGGIFHFALSLTELSHARSLDAYPVVSCVAFRNDSGNLLDPATSGLSYPQTQLYGIYNSAPLAFKARSHDGSTPMNGIGLFYGGQVTYNGMPNIAWVYDAHGAGGIPAIGNDGANIVDGTDDFLPQFVAFVEYGKGVKGQPLDVHQGPRRAPGSMNPNVNPSHVNLGGICIPMRHAPNMG
jgi:hypothetical protein